MQFLKHQAWFYKPYSQFSCSTQPCVDTDAYSAVSHVSAWVRTTFPRDCQVLTYRFINIYICIYIYICMWTTFLVDCQGGWGARRTISLLGFGRLGVHLGPQIDPKLTRHRWPTQQCCDHILIALEWMWFNFLLVGDPKRDSSWDWDDIQEGFHSNSTH